MFTDPEGNTELTLSLPRQLNSIGGSLERISVLLVRNGISNSLRRKILLATEEVSVNAIVHGGEEADDPLKIAVAISAQTVLVSVEYTGPEFDPSQSRFEKPADASTLGGHGLNLINKLAEKVSYSHVAGINSVELTLFRMPD